MLFFSGFLVLDEQFRRNNKRMDVICCLKTSASGCGDDRRLESILGKMAHLFSFKWAKVGIILVFGCLAAGGILGISRIEVSLHCI